MSISAFGCDCAACKIIYQAHKSGLPIPREELLALMEQHAKSVDPYYGVSISRRIELKIDKTLRKLEEKA